MSVSKILSKFATDIELLNVSGALQAAINAGGGGTPSNVVFLTGDQNISGRKSFKQDVEFYDSLGRLSYKAESGMFYGYDSTGQFSIRRSVGLNTRALYDSSNSISVDWSSSRSLFVGSSQVLNWGNQILKNQSNVETLNWDQGYTSDSSSVASIDWEDRALINSNENGVLSWEYCSMDDPEGNASIDWAYRALSSPGEGIAPASQTLTWHEDSSFLMHGTKVVFNWTDAIFYDSDEIATANTRLRALYDSEGENSLLWGDRKTFRQNDTEAIDWQLSNLVGDDGSVRMNWSLSTLYGVGPSESLNWGSRQLIFNSEISLDWENKILSGEWKSNSNDTNPDSIVTYKKLSQMYGTPFGFGFDGGGNVLTSGAKARKFISKDCSITGWRIVGDQAGSILIDLAKGTPSGGTIFYSSIVGSNYPRLSSNEVSGSANLSGWTVELKAGDVVEASIASSVSSIEQVTITFEVG